MSLFYFVTAFYIIFCLAYVIKHRNYYSREKFMALTALLPINSAAIIVQMIWSDYLVESFFMAIGCLLIIITIQRPEEIIDALTGLKNFPTYLGELQQVYNSKAEVSFICINVANLPRLTNIFSPESLQEFMSLVTDKIQQANKKTKVRAELYYIGNGCFRAFLREYSPKKALRFAYDVNASLKEPFVFNGMDFNLIAYVCYGSIPDDVETYDDFMSFGRYFHKVIPYSGEVLTLAEILKDNQFEIRKNLNTIIDNAFANKSFEVYYQPIYSLKEKRFTTAEALLRLKDETYGFISPELFIPMAEKNGSIHKIGDFVMEEVCRFIGSEEFKELGLSYIEVNLSVAQCISPHLADNICSVMEQYKVSPHQINLEITETAAAYNQTAMLQNIDDLKRAGLTFSLDDYGMGYSNIESFSSLPLKIVKLDKNFISWVDQPHMKIVLTHTVQMLEELDLQIVIEGVETEQMLQYFSSLGCDYIQGYYFSKPLPKKDFVSFIKNHLGGLSHEEFSMG
jgi:EAL domain-containing protein (putative c-di-GMP-specific phosphodiesterase class I)/GGDEF domain-containing protein